MGPFSSVGLFYNFDTLFVLMLIVLGRVASFFFSTTGSGFVYSAAFSGVLVCFWFKIG